MPRPISVLFYKISIAMSLALLALGNAALVQAISTVDLVHLSCVDVVVSGTAARKYVEVTVDNVAFTYVPVPDQIIRIGAAGPLPVEANGTFNLTVRFTTPIKNRYVAIRIWEEDSGARNRSLIGSFDRAVECPVTYPQAPRTDQVYVTAQRFDYGLMFWRKDTGDIWVLLENRVALKYPQSAYSRLVERSVSNPAHRIKPILGFGKIWSNSPDIRKGIGWPTLPEIGWVSEITTRYDQQSSIELTQLDGRIIAVFATERGYSWQYGRLAQAVQSSSGS